MKFFTLATTLALATGALANVDVSQKVKHLNLDKETCNTGFGQIAIRCEKCARSGIECLLYPDQKEECSGGKSEHASNCNGCLDKIFELLN